MSPVILLSNQLIKTINIYHVKHVKLCLKDKKVSNHYNHYQLKHIKAQAKL